MAPRDRLHKLAADWLDVWPPVVAAFMIAAATVAGAAIVGAGTPARADRGLQVPADLVRRAEAALATDRAGAARPLTTTLSLLLYEPPAGGHCDVIYAPRHEDGSWGTWAPFAYIERGDDGRPIGGAGRELPAGAWVVFAACGIPQPVPTEEAKPEPVHLPLVLKCGRCKR